VISISADLGRLLALDSDEPGARLDRFFEGGCTSRETACAVLLALVEIDALLEVHLGVSSLYLIEDTCLYAVLARAIPSEVFRDEIRTALLLLNHADLIFRFNCARKFRIADTALKQMRINGWGKWYAEARRLEQEYTEVRGAVGAEVMPLIEDSAEVYGQLAQVLGTPITPGVAETVAGLNRAVSLKLLS
jgi:hypothetical protein